MFSLTTTQIQTLTTAVETAFCAGLRQRLLAFDKTRTENEAADLVSTSLAKARAYGFQTRRELAAFTLVMGCLGPDFDTAPQKRWAGRLLIQSDSARHERIELLLDWTARELREQDETAEGVAAAFDRAWSELDELPCGADPLLPVKTLTIHRPPGYRPVSVTIREAPLLDWALTPGSKTATQTLHALGSPTGGYFEWRCDNNETLALEAHEAEARLTAKNLGEGVVGVRYTAPHGEACGEVRIRVRAAASIHVSPSLRQFGTVTIGGQSPPRTVTVTNVGGSPLQLGNVRPPRGFTLSEDAVSGQILAPKASASLKLSFLPEDDAAVDHELSLPSDACNQAEGSLRLRARGCWPAPRLALVRRPDGQPLEYVRIGCWDRAWNPKTGVLFNRAAENHHFIGRDRHRFHILITDASAAARGQDRVTADWWVCRDRTGASGHRLGSAAICLRRLGNTDNYLSPSLMLVTDEDDYRQATHGGPGSSGLIQAGKPGHRLRLTVIDERDRLNHHVRVRYLPEKTGAAIELKTPVFKRQPDERKSCVLNLVRLRLNKSPSFTNAAAVKVYSRVMRTILARLGIYLSIRDRVVNPPPDMGPGQGAAEVALAVVTREGRRGKPRIVPAPSQLTIVRNCRQDAGLHLFFVGSLADPITGATLAGQAFDADRTCRDVSGDQITLQWRARCLVHRLSPDRELYATTPWTNARRKRLGQALEEAQRAAQGKSHQTAAKALLAALTAIEGSGKGHPVYVRKAITAARENLPKMPFPSETLADLLASARGCAFVAGPDRIDKYAPAHQLVHLLAGADHVALAHHLMAQGNPPSCPDPSDDAKRLWWQAKAATDEVSQPGFDSVHLTAYEEGK